MHVYNVSLPLAPQPSHQWISYLPLNFMYLFKIVQMIYIVMLLKIKKTSIEMNLHKTKQVVLKPAIQWYLIYSQHSATTTFTGAK